MLGLQLLERAGPSGASIRCMTYHDMVLHELDRLLRLSEQRHWLRAFWRQPFLVLSCTCLCAFKFWTKWWKAPSLVWDFDWKPYRTLSGWYRLDGTSIILEVRVGERVSWARGLLETELTIRMALNGDSTPSASDGGSND